MYDTLRLGLTFAGAGAVVVVVAGCVVVVVVVPEIGPGVMGFGVGRTIGGPAIAADMVRCS